MNILAEGLDIPGEAISVLLLLLISFFGWVKNRFLDKKEEELFDPEEERLREIVWRRQMGEDIDPRELYEEQPVPRATIHVDPKPVVRSTPPSFPPAMPSPPPMPRRVTKVSDREASLARAFEGSLPGRQRKRTSHRRQVDRLLRSPSAAKDAILLTEILGPPVSLKSGGQDHA